MAAAKKSTGKTQNKSTLKKLVGAFNPKDLKGGMALFALIFAVAGGGYFAYRSFAATTPLLFSTASFSSPNELTQIKTVNADGTGDNVLASGILDPSDPFDPNEKALTGPQYSYSGTKVAWVESPEGSETSKIVVKDVAQLTSKGSGIRTYTLPNYVTADNQFKLMWGTTDHSISFIGHTKFSNLWLIMRLDVDSGDFQTLANFSDRVNTHSARSIDQESFDTFVYVDNRGVRRLKLAREEGKDPAVPEVDSTIHNGADCKKVRVAGPAAVLFTCNEAGSSKLLMQTYSTTKTTLASFANTSNEYITDFAVAPDIKKVALFTTKNVPKDQTTCTYTVTRVLKSVSINGGTVSKLTGIGTTFDTQGCKGGVGPDNDAVAWSPDATMIAFTDGLYQVLSGGGYVIGKVQTVEYANPTNKKTVAAKDVSDLSWAAGKMFYGSVASYSSY
jgi:hypothetical protein